MLSCRNGMRNRSDRLAEPTEIREPQILIPMEFAAIGNTPCKETSERPSFLTIAVSVSVLLHLLIAYLLVKSDIEAPLRETPEFVEITLRPTNPNRVLESPPNEPVEEPLVEPPTSAEVPSVRSRDEEERVAQAQEPSGLIESITDIPSDESLATEVHKTQSTSVNRLPTLQAISQSVRELSRSREAQFYPYVCNPLEEDEGIKECAPRSSTAFGALETNSVYQALNSTRELSRSERAAGVVSSQARSLTDRLEVELPAGISDYLIQELEAGISHSVNEGNRAVQHMIDMTDKSDAAAQARQVLNNPLLLDLKRGQQNPARGIQISPP